MKFNLFILIGVVFSLVVLPMVVASEAKISYAVANKPVVYDIPFSVNVLADTKDFPKDKPPITVPILEYGVTVTSDTSKALFQSHSKSDPATLNAKTGSLDTNTKYRVFTDSSGNSWTPATLFTVGVKFTGKPIDEKGTKIILDAKAPVGHFFTPATGKGSPFNSIISTDSELILPQLSQCGDGVVGYVDTNINGIKDAGEAEEACDSADGKNTDDVTKVVKCVDCKYVAIGYQPVNCGFGSYGCTIKKMTSQELFLARITALVNKACYPDANHPAAEFCKDKKPIEYYTDNKIEGERKLEFIVQVGRILKEFFTGLPN